MQSIPVSSEAAKPHPAICRIEVLRLDDLNPAWVSPALEPSQGHLAPHAGVCHGYGVATTFTTQLLPLSEVTWYIYLRSASCLMS